MKKFLLAILLALLCLGDVCAQESLDSKVAIVNLIKPEIISRKQLDQTVRVLKANGINKSEQEILEVMIDDVLLKQGTEKEGIKITDAEIISALRKEVGASEKAASDDQLKQFVEQRMQVSWDVYADRSRTTLGIQRYIRKVKGSKLANIPTPSQPEIQRFYDSNSKQFFIPKTVTLDHIYVDTRSLSADEKKKALERINGYSSKISKNSKEFDKLVEFTDDSASKYNNGRFGTLRIDDASRRKFMGEEFFNAVFAMNKGDISSVITSNVGYHIVRVADVSEPRLLGIHEKVAENQKLTVSDTIKQYLTAQKQEMIFKECVKEATDDLRKKADIKYFLK